MNSGLNQNAEIPTERENPTVTFVRVDNVEAIGNRLTIQKTLAGVVYTKIIKKNAAGEIIQVLPWTK